MSPSTRAARRLAFRLSLILLAVSTVCGLSSCSKSVTPSTHTVLIQGLRYSPATIRVHQGDTIIFVNDDIVPHTVTDRGNAFDSGLITSSQKWRLVPTEVGTFNYSCTVHPNMEGTIEVEMR